MKPSKPFLLAITLIWITFQQVVSQIQPIKINLNSNGNKLNADVYPGSSDKFIPTLILMHGFPGGEGDLFGLGKNLSPNGVNVLIFNNQGAWSSEGEFSFEACMQDVGSAINFLRQKDNIERFKIDTSNIIVGGYSNGAAMTLIAAVYNPEIKRIISIAGADESIILRKQLADSSFRIMFEQGLKQTAYPNGPIKFNPELHQKYLFSNLDRFDLYKHAEALKNRDILFIGGWHDQMAETEEQILPLLIKLKNLDADNIEIRLFNTDHYFKNTNRDELTQIILNWIIDK
jgi:pimeloyl-ACP methyl ester carboxylesterase